MISGCGSCRTHNNSWKTIYLEFRRESPRDNTAMSSVFDTQKKSCLSAVDLSRKGSIDAPIEQLVGYINELLNYFTTSSCSGRTIVVDNDADGAVRKQGCKWLLTSHDTINTRQLIDSLLAVENNAVFKFEPFVMHVQCRTLADAQLLLSCGVGSGFRNSGISIGNKGKFITAIRSTQCLEVPLTHNGDLIVDEKYLNYLVQLANGKMQSNIERIDRFHENLQAAIDSKDDDTPVKCKKLRKSHSSHKPNKDDPDKVENGNPEQTKSDCDNHSDNGIIKEETESIEDLGQCAMFECDLDT